jgi:hypothetical protein
MFLHFTDQVAVAVGLAPSADVFSGTVSSDVFSLENFSKAVLLINKAAGATGTSLITIQACDDLAGNNPVPIPFNVTLQDADGQNRGARTEVAATGFTTAAAANKVYAIELQADHLPEGKPCFFLKGVEQVDSPIVGDVTALFFGGRYQGADLKNPTL